MENLQEVFIGKEKLAKGFQWEIKRNFPVSIAESSRQVAHNRKLMEEGSMKVVERDVTALDEWSKRQKSQPSVAIKNMF